MSNAEPWNVMACPRTWLESTACLFFAAVQLFDIDWFSPETTKCLYILYVYVDIGRAVSACHVVNHCTSVFIDMHADVGGT